MQKEYETENEAESMKRRRGSSNLLSLHHKTSFSFERPEAVLRVGGRISRFIHFVACG